jgi:hypothetical protein
MVHAQHLKTRIEMRVNRIPMALRKAKMEDLLLKYTANPAKAMAGSSREKAKSPMKQLIQEGQKHSSPSLSSQRGAKRLRYGSVCLIDMVC